MSAKTSNEAADIVIAAPEDQPGQSAQEQEVAVATHDADANQLHDSDDQIPEKFVGKSPLEIIRSYQNAEKTIGRLGSEKAQRERELEEERQKRLALEAQFAQQQQAAAQAQYNPPAQQEQDPVQVLESTWHESPLEAVKRALQTKDQRDAFQRRQEHQQRMAAATAARWEELKRTNPEATELEPVMSQLAQQYRHLVAPEKLNSPEFVDLLYTQAKARNADKYIAAEVDKRLQKNNAIKQEKRSAFSESSNSQGASTRNVNDMSREELKALIGYSDK